jgi:DNA-binding NarL/FixJ family response regulator
MLVDDDPLVRRALREALGDQPGFTVVAEASNGVEAVNVAIEEQPDVVLIDIDMPGAEGLTATARLTRMAPDMRVVMISTWDDDELGLLGLRAGAEGFLTKDTDIDALTRSLVGVVHGEAAISRRLTRRVVQAIRGVADGRSGMRPVKSQLTSREWQVLDLMSAGRSTETIAQTLVLSIETVRSHVKHILAKLGAHSRAEAIDIADRLRQRPGTSIGEKAGDELLLRRAAERLADRRRAQQEDE